MKDNVEQVLRLLIQAEKIKCICEPCPSCCADGQCEANLHPPKNGVYTLVTGIATDSKVSGLFTFEVPDVETCNDFLVVVSAKDGSGAVSQLLLEIL